jgi:hypothetical protein
MKYVFCFILVILSLIMITSSSCKKDYATNYTGNYIFTTIGVAWTIDTVACSDTITYYGRITLDSEHRLKINYANYKVDTCDPTYLIVYGTITPLVDNEGILSYPEWEKTYYNSFDGTFDNNGGVKFKINGGGKGAGSLNKVEGLKIN